MTQANNSLWQDIQAQGENLRAVIEHLLSHEQKQLESVVGFAQNDKPIALVGIGSAAYLCELAASYLNQHGRPASVIYASDAYYTAFPALRKSNVIVNSRSGETVEIVKLCKKLNEEGIHYSVITNEPDSTAARLAQHVIWSNTRKDDLVSINVVTAMMTSTLITAASISSELDALLPEVKRLPDILSDSVDRSIARADEILEFFRGIRPIYLLYRGADKAGAYCGRLVLEEVARQPAVALEAAEFRQGPIEVLDQDFGAVVFVPHGSQGQLNSILVENMASNSGRVLAVGNVAQAVPGVLAFPVTRIPDELLSIAALPPLQVLAYKLAESQGYMPGQVRYISKVITTETGIPGEA